MTKEQFDVTGMTCAACSARVENCVGKLPGVTSVTVNLLTNSMTVAFDDSKLNVEEIVKAVETAGYGAAPKGKLVRKKTKEKVNTARDEYKKMKLRLLFSAIFT